MKIANFATVVVGAAISEIFSDAQCNAALAVGLEQICLNPSVAIVLVDASGGNAWPNIPGAIAGTATNSPFTCAANTPTMVAHNGGSISGITTGADATVKRAFAVDQ